MSKIEIIDARTPDQLQRVAALLRDYLLWVHRRYCSHAELIDRYFGEQAWASELADLSGHYDAVVLAIVDGTPAGCVVMHRIDEDACEIKRLFVRPAFHGLGVAQALVTRIATLAAARGYVFLRLETGPLQVEAQALYRKLGFARVPPGAAGGRPGDYMLFFQAPSRDVAARARSHAAIAA